MIVGDGMLANAFSRYSDAEGVIIFASGVSNSNEIRKECFDREKELLLRTLEYYKGRMFVYFSSCDTKYAALIGKEYYYHKLHMEAIVRKAQWHYIFRLPQVLGKSNNKHTLVNYFIDSIHSGTKINVFRNAYKNIIGIQEVLQITSYIIENKIFPNSTVNIINNNYYSVFDLVRVLEKLLRRKAIIELVESGFKPNYDQPAIPGFSIKYGPDYLENSIKLNYWVEIDQ